MKTQSEIRTTLKTTKALTIRQPYASAIILGHKPVENRTWQTKYRGPLLIHTGASQAHLAHTPVDQVIALCNPDPHLQFPDGPWENTLPFRAILGVVTLIDCVNVTEQEAAKRWPIWGFGPYCWVLENPIAFPVPVAWQKGAQGLWNAPEDAFPLKYLNLIHST